GHMTVIFSPILTSHRGNGGNVSALPLIKAFGRERRFCATGMCFGLRISSFPHGGCSMTTPPKLPEERPFLGVHLRCCNLYARLYLNAAKDACVGWCPRCAKQVRADVVAEGGSTGRFYEAS